jgi:hypothetical protein
VVDLSNPHAPQAVASRAVPGAAGLAAYAPTAGEAFVYVAAGDAGLAIVDARDPRRPEVALQAVAGTYSAACVAQTAGGPLLCAAGPRGVALLSLRDPAAPRLVASLPLAGARSVSVVRCPDGRDIAYIAAADSLALADVSDPAAPRLLISVAVDDARQVAVQVEPDGRVYACVADGAGGLKVVDASDPSAPRLFGDLTTGAVEAVALRSDLSGRQYALTAGPSGFAVVDVFTQGRSLQVASARTGGGGVAVALGTLPGTGDVAVVADGPAGIRLFAARDPAKLRDDSLLASLRTENAVDVELDAGGPQPRIFVADGARGLRVVAVEGDPGRPRLRALLSLETGGDARAVELLRSGDRLLAVAADSRKGLSVFDVTDTANARQVASLALPDARDVSVTGNLACVASDSGGLVLVDLADPAAPRIRSRVASLNARTVDAAPTSLGTVLCAVTGPAGLTLVDVTDRDAPRVRALYGTAYAQAAAIAGDRVHLAEGIKGLTVLDASRPDAPRRVSSSDVEYAVGVAVRGDFAFVTDRQGLRVVRVLVPDWLVGGR